MEGNKDTGTLTDLIQTEGFHMPQVGDVYQEIRADKRFNQQTVTAVDGGLITMSDDFCHLWAEIINPRRWCLIQTVIDVDLNEDNDEEAGVVDPASVQEASPKSTRILAAAPPGYISARRQKAIRSVLEKLPEKHKD